MKRAAVAGLRAAVLAWLVVCGGDDSGAGDATTSSSTTPGASTTTTSTTSSTGDPTVATTTTGTTGTTGTSSSTSSTDTGADTDTDTDTTTSTETSAMGSEITGTTGELLHTVLEHGPGLNLAIVDDGYDGSLRSMACLVFNVPAQGLDTVASVVVDLGIDHPFVGDLTVKVESPSAVVVAVTSRPGLAEPADDGTACCGDSSNLAATAEITFDDLAGPFAEFIGNTISDDETVCVDDGQCAFVPQPDTGPGTALADFAGTDAVGEWRVCVADSSAGDAGTIDHVTLRLTTIP